jgi:hypothetical protein
MYKTQLVTTKGDSIRTFVSSSRPATRFGSEGCEISYTDNDTSFTIMGSWNVIIDIRESSGDSTARGAL